MAAPVFVVDADVAARASAGDVVDVSGAEARHASVARLGVGETVEVTDGRGRRMSGVVAQVSAQTLSVRVESVVDEPEPAGRLVVVQGLLKGDHGDLALDQLTQVGVDVIVPWAADHSVVQLRGERADKAGRKWAARIASAAKQSRRARWPELAPLATTADIAARLAAADRAVVLHEAATTPLADVTMPATGTTVLVVGPEGGIATAELDAFTAAGATLALLGPSVLRGSLAGAVGAGIVQARGRWSGMAGSTS